MKKSILISVCTAALLFTGCGEETKKEAADATSKAIESTKEAAGTALDATKKAADKAVEATKDASKKAVEATEKAAEAVKKTASSAADSVQSAAKEATAGAGNEEGAKLYAACSGCHGVDGKTKALGKSAVIAGQSKGDLETKLQEYKAGTRNVAGMGMLMKGQVASMDEKSISLLAEYISTLK